MGVFLLIEVLVVFVLLPVLTLTEVIIPLCRSKPLFPLVDKIKKITNNQNEEE